MTILDAYVEMIIPSWRECKSRNRNEVHMQYRGLQLDSSFIVCASLVHVGDPMTLRLFTFFPCHEEFTIVGYYKLSWSGANIRLSFLAPLCAVGSLLYR
jgi:hypothetical protein